MKLVKYEAARHALAEARRVDEVKDIRDKAIAMAEYAKQAKDPDLELWAKEIRFRAERRAGEMLGEMELAAKAKFPVGNPGHGLRAGSAQRTPQSSSTLADLGVTKHESSTWQRLAKVPEKVFERRTGLWPLLLWLWSLTRDTAPHQREGR